MMISAILLQESYLCVSIRPWRKGKKKKKRLKIKQEAIRETQYERNRQQAEEERRKRESDPKYIAKIKNQQLRMRLG